jgi:hypothetical protein
MAKKLTKKQIAILDDLFIGELDEQAVLDKYNVSRNLYFRWLADACPEQIDTERSRSSRGNSFAEQFDSRIAAAYRQSAALLARYATLAAAKLVQLTDSSSPETARKACLDIISMQPADQRRMMDEGRGEMDACPERNRRDGGRTTDDGQRLSPETAGKILEVLAQEEPVIPALSRNPEMSDSSAAPQNDKAEEPDTTEEDNKSA